MRHRAVDDVSAMDPCFEREHTGLQLGDHAFAHAPFCEHVTCFLKGHARNERILIIEVFVEAVHIGEEDDLLRADRTGNSTRDRICIDVERAAIFTFAYRCDNGHVRCIDERLEVGWIHFDHAANAPEFWPNLLSHDRARISTIDPNSQVAMLVHSAHELLVHLADQGHLHDFHGLFGSDAQSIDEFNIYAEAFHIPRDVRATAMNDDRIHPHDLERIDHGSSTLFYHDGLARLILDIRERFDEHLCGVRRRELSIFCIFHTGISNSW